MPETRPLHGREDRPIRIYTRHGPIQGFLVTSPMIRTLDDLNTASRTFFSVDRAESFPGEHSDSTAPLAVNKGSILFVMELDDQPPIPHHLTASGRFSRSRVRLWVDDYRIEGNVHVPVGGSALPLLNQDTHRFIALTAASIEGPDGSFEAPFLAVRRSEIQFARETGVVEHREASAG